MVGTEAEQGRACQLVARPRIGRAEGARAFRPLGCVAANATQRTPRGARVATLVPSAHRGNPSPRRRRRPALGVLFLRRCAAGGTCSRPPEAAKQKRSPAPGERESPEAVSPHREGRATPTADAPPCMMHVWTHGSRHTRAPAPSSRPTSRSRRPPTHSHTHVHYRRTCGSMKRMCARAPRGHLDRE